MRFLASCLILFFLSSCAGEAARQQEETLRFTTRWDSTTALVTEQITGIIKVQEKAQRLLSALDTLSETPPDSLKSQLEETLQKLGRASETSFLFVNRWQEGASLLNELKEKEESRVSETGLKQLKELEQEGQQQAKEWSAQLDSARVLFEKAEMILY